MSLKLRAQACIRECKTLRQEFAREEQMLKARVGLAKQARETFEYHLDKAVEQDDVVKALKRKLWTQSTLAVLASVYCVLLNVFQRLSTYTAIKNVSKVHNPNNEILPVFYRATEGTPVKGKVTEADVVFGRSGSPAVPTSLQARRRSN